MILKGKYVTLRPIEKEDLELMRELINDPDMERMIVGWTLPISSKDQENWFSSFRNSDTTIRYIIENAIEGTVGFTGITDIDWKNGCAKGTGIRISKKCQNNGMATDAYMTMLRYVFEELRLHRFEESAVEYNVASQRFIEKCGFKREGVERECVFKEGRYHNKIIFAILKSDYDELLINNDYWNYPNKNEVFLSSSTRLQKE